MGLKNFLSNPVTFWGSGQIYRVRGFNPTAGRMGEPQGVFPYTFRCPTVGTAERGKSRGGAPALLLTNTFPLHQVCQSAPAP